MGAAASTVSKEKTWDGGVQKMKPDLKRYTKIDQILAGCQPIRVFGKGYDDSGWTNFEGKFAFSRINHLSSL